MRNKIISFYKQQPNEKEIYRIYEVIFYLICEKLDELPGTVDRYLYNLSNLVNTTPSRIIESYNLLNKNTNLPTKQEISIVLAYLEIPYTEIKKNYIHPDTYYRYSKDYFDGNDKNLAIPILAPRLEMDYIEELLKFISGLRDILPALDLSKRRIIYG